MMDDNLLHNSFILFEIICVIAVFAIFLIRSHFFTEVLEHHPRIITQIILIIFYGLLSIVGTVTGISLFGSIGNVRDIGPMIAGLTCGPLIGIGAGIIGGVFRFMQGGPYMYTGLSAPIFCGIMGGVLYLANNRNFVSTNIATLYMALCDTLVSIVTLTLVTPPNQLWSITGNIAIPMIAGSTIGVFVFSTFIHAQIAERIREKEFYLLERENADRKNLDAVINTIADPVFLLNHDFCWTLVNDVFCQFVGKTRENIIGTRVTDIFGQSEHESILSQAEEVFASRKPCEMEITLTSAEGEKRIFIAKSALYIDSNGNESILGVLRDISERKKMEETITESEARLTSVLHGSPMMQFVIDHSHQVISWNKAIEKYTGVPADEMLGTSDQWKPFYRSKRPLLADILVDEKTDSFKEWFEKPITPARHVEGAYEGTIFQPDKGPSGRWVYFTAAPIRDTKGSLIGAVETLEDITEQKHTEADLKLSLKKINLLSTITRHDILNKISILSSYLYLLTPSIKDTEGIENLTRAVRTTEIIQKQIAFTGEYQELGVKAPVWQKISEVVDEAACELIGDTITFDVSVTPYEIFADPLLIKVFHNLFENARSHGERVTRISVTDYLSDTSLIIRVADNGVGIVDEDKPYIFEKGFGKNTGFGLFLSYEILAITGMSITETGELGKGASFEITVPKSGYREKTG